ADLYLPEDRGGAREGARLVTGRSRRGGQALEDPEGARAGPQRDRGDAEGPGSGKGPGQEGGTVPQIRNSTGSRGNPPRGGTRPQQAGRDAQAVGGPAGQKGGHSDFV